MSRVKDMIYALRKCAKEHENEVGYTGQIMTPSLCRDVADYLEADTAGGEEMSGHKIIVELEPENEKDLREIAEHFNESVSAVASRILNSHFEQIRAREHFYALNRAQNEEE